MFQIDSNSVEVDSLRFGGGVFNLVDKNCNWSYSFVREIVSPCEHKLCPVLVR